jgi:hypothetical protein
VTPVFDAPSSPSGLAEYCVYEWAGAGVADPIALQGDLSGSIDITSWSEDTVVIASLGGSTDEATRPGSGTENLALIPALRASLREGFRDLGRGGLASPPPGTGVLENVEIAVIDSSPTDITGGIPLGRSAHGHVVGWSAHDLLCDGPLSTTCFGHVSTYLALPHVTAGEVDCVHGGGFGTRVELARQIFRAVETWKPQVGSRPRLVIPLALGWDPASGDPTDAASQAVHAALVHAACHGAFLAAAAGNDTGGKSPPGGLVYPAAWESEYAPTLEACATFEDVDSIDTLLAAPHYPILPAAGAKTPLILSIGGVDRADRPIALTRPRSLTQLVALAFQADAGDPSRPLPQPLTGTSIGVTVAGATAAAVWARNPTMTAADVMDTLVNTASPLAPIEDTLCAEAGCEPRRVSFCAAIAAACAAGPDTGLASSARCAAAPRCDEMSELAPSSLTPTLVKSLDAYFLTDMQPPTGQIVSQSPHDLVSSIGGGDGSVFPQPIDPGCSVCVFSRTRGLYVELDTRLLSPLAMTLTLFSAPTLSTARVSASTTFTLTSAGPRWTSGPMTTPTSVTSAMLSWISPSTLLSVSEQIAVTP